MKSLPTLTKSFVVDGVVDEDEDGDEGPDEIIDEVGLGGVRGVEGDRDTRHGEDSGEGGLHVGALVLGVV